MGRAVGIDLGTTNSVIAATEGGQPQVVSFATAEPGALAVGDVRSGSTKRVASAVGEGAIAVRQAYEHLRRTGRR